MSAVWFCGSNASSSENSGSPQRMIDRHSYPVGTTTSSTLAGTGAIGSKASLPPLPPGIAAAGAASPATVPPMTIAAAAAPAPASTVRRDMLALTMSRKYPLSEVFGTGWKHASAHLRWQVTALRLPEVCPCMGSSGSMVRRATGRTDEVVSSLRAGSWVMVIGGSHHVRCAGCRRTRSGCRDRERDGRMPRGRTVNLG